MYCHHCSSIMDEDDKFFKSCGREVIEGQNKTKTGANSGSTRMGYSDKINDYIYIVNK